MVKLSLNRSRRETTQGQIISHRTLSRTTHLNHILIKPLPPPQRLKRPPLRQRTNPHPDRRPLAHHQQLAALSLAEADGIEARIQQIRQEGFGEAGDAAAGAVLGVFEVADQGREEVVCGGEELVAVRQGVVGGAPPGELWGGG